MGTSSQNVYFWDCGIFFWPSGYPINSIFQWQYVFTTFTFWWSIFPLNCQNTHGHQTFQGDDMLRGAPTHKYHDNSTEWFSGVTWQKNISQPAEDLSIPHQARCWLSVRGSQTWPFDQVTNVRSIWEMYIFHFHKVYS